MLQQIEVACDGSIQPDNSSQVSDYNLLCVPSHSGPFPVALQPQKKTFLSASASYLRGEYPLSLCEPSQNGCLEDCPQVHQKYDLPAVTSIG